MPRNGNSPWIDAKRLVANAEGQVVVGRKESRVMGDRTGDRALPVREDVAVTRTGAAVPATSVGVGGLFASGHGPA